MATATATATVALATAPSAGLRPAPWKKTSAEVKPVSLAQVMNEQERDTQSRTSVKSELKRPLRAAAAATAPEYVDLPEGVELTEDFLLALQIQHELDQLEAAASSSSEDDKEQEDDDDLELAKRLDAELNGSDVGNLERSDEIVPATMMDAEDEKAHHDYLVAMRLQAQFDAEHDAHLAAFENQRNAGAKVNVSYRNYQRAPMLTSDDFWEDPDLQVAELSDDDDQDLTAEMDAQDPTLTVRPAKTIITKHDIPITTRRNAKKIERLPLSFNSGNTVDFKEMRVSNRVFNELREHSNRPAPRAGRDNNKLHGKEDVSTHNRVLDPRTRLILFRMIGSGSLQGVSGVISSGKEANVYGGIATIEEYQENPENPPTTTEEGEVEVEVEPTLVNLPCAIKIFKTTLDDFRNRFEYIREDQRFTNRLSRHNPGKLIKLWAEKEMSNLQRLNRAHIPCPQVLYYKKHVLVMSLIGDDTPAPKLKDAVSRMSSSTIETCYRQCLRDMRQMYQKAGLVHADLSEYNVLFHENQLWFIDVSQSVESIHPNAPFYLHRDCLNMSKFFASVGVPNALNDLELFAYVTSADVEGATQDRQFHLARDRVALINRSKAMTPDELERVLTEILPTFWPMGQQRRSDGHFGAADYEEKAAGMYLP